MSFDSRSLDRLRELGRSLPKRLPEPEPAVTPKARQVRHKVETEQDPDLLFQELMQVSPDGTVPERLKELEQRRIPAPTNTTTAAAARDLPPLPRNHAGPGKTTRPQPPNVPPGSEEESLYVAFGQLLLEDDEVSD
ncbi:hypothetical protein N8483_02985 [Synechococcus sp. AH-601-O20]|nr:hypothetical protein [Synechococcus sp. AH-601-O20]